mgnify:CR=1 FL=1
MAAHNWLRRARVRRIAPHIDEVLPPQPDLGQELPERKEIKRRPSRPPKPKVEKVESHVYSASGVHFFDGHEEGEIHKVWAKKDDFISPEAAMAAAKERLSSLRRSSSWGRFL